MQNLPATPAFPKPFASNQDDRNSGDIPTSGDSGINWTNGFPSIFQKLISDGGRYVQRKDMNTILYALSNALCYQQQGGIVTWNATLSSLITGYPEHARIWWNDGTNWNIIESQYGNNQIEPTATTVDQKTDGTGQPSASGTIKWKRVLLMQPDKCLPLTGGTMTGAIQWSGKSLTSPSSGTLTWEGRNIVRSVNGVYAGTNGNVGLSVWPNYNGASDISTGWTATGNGWILWKCNSPSATRTLYIDNVEVAVNYTNDSGTYIFMLPIASGSVVTFTVGTCRFVPAKVS